MKNLDADVIRRNLSKAAAARLGSLEIFAEIDSTNSYLMQRPGPQPGELYVAATDNQTAGRGRQGRSWWSPPGAGLCLSMAYTFALPPSNLPALTLAIGIGAIETLKELQVMDVQLKWPNDLIAMDSKLGGILTEAQTLGDGSVTIVTGIGLNIDFDGLHGLVPDAHEARPPIDMNSLVAALPDSNRIAASLIGGLGSTIVGFEAGGFMVFNDKWAEHDWLFGREVTIDTPQRRITGTGAGVADDGALLLDTPTEGRQRVTSGSIVMTGTRATGA